MSLLPEPDPTMEEILFSIHRSISDDNGAPLSHLELDTAEADLSGILELTEELEIKSDTPAQTIAVFTPTSEAPDAAAKLISAQIENDIGECSPLPQSGNLSVEHLLARTLLDAFEPAFHNFIAYNSAPIIHCMRPVVRDWMESHVWGLLEGIIRAEIEHLVKTPKHR